MTLEAVIGLEIHVQLKTKSKMFCSCANVFGDLEPNSAICPICLGYPGTLPVPNKKAIDWAQLIGAALNCELAKQSKFDRKSYFYPDLPKAYQISQYDQPFCGPGHLDLTVDTKPTTIGITRVHLEEDAAKNTHPKGANYTLVDYNRAGTPLVEIVTEPDIKSAGQAKAFLRELRRIMRTLGVSDADMEKGQLRCDANISVREQGSQDLNPKSEVKNLNSFRNVERALQYEISRQTKEFAAGRLPKQDTTRGFDADAGTTTEQRSKEGAADYRYFPEPDIPPFSFSADELKQRQIDLPELPAAKQERLMRQYSLSEQQASLLVDNLFLADFLENTASELEQMDNDRIDLDVKDRKPLVQKATNIILQELRDLVEQEQLDATTLNISPENFAELVILIALGKINSNVVSQVLKEMQRTGGDPDPIIDKLGLAQVRDTGDLASVIDEVIAENADVVDKVKSGKTTALQFLMGQVMKKTQGKADAQAVTEILRQKILK